VVELGLFLFPFVSFGFLFLCEFAADFDLWWLIDFSGGAEGWKVKFVHFGLLFRDDNRFLIFLLTKKAEFLKRLLVPGFIFVFLELLIECFFQCRKVHI
jgi:hypothetical protein